MLKRIFCTVENRSAVIKVGKLNMNKNLKNTYM